MIFNNFDYDQVTTSTGMDIRWVKLDSVPGFRAVTEHQRNCLVGDPDQTAQLQRTVSAQVGNWLCSVILDASSLRISKTKHSR